MRVYLEVGELLRVHELERVRAARVPLDIRFSLYF